MNRLKPYLIGLAICLLSAVGALAHSTMNSSTPAEGSTAAAGLSEITLGFSKPVRLMLVKVRNADRKTGIEADFKPASQYSATFPFKVAPLETGRHQVTWTAIAKDGHVMKGTLTFKIAK